MIQEKPLYPDAMPDCRGQSIRPGDAVILTTQHPHDGRRGTYKGVEAVGDSFACLVQFDDGGGCYVFRANQWRKVEVDRRLEQHRFTDSGVWIRKSGGIT